MTKNEYKDLLIKTSEAGHFPAMGRVNNGVTCMYLTPEGRKCAIGILLPDGHDAQKARVSAAFLFDDYPDLKQFIPDGMTVYDLVRVQLLHDDIALWREKWDHNGFVNRIQEYFK